MKEMMFLNSALESQVRECKGRVSQARSDRQILLNKLLAHEANEDRETENKILHQMLDKKVLPRNDKNFIVNNHNTPKSGLLDKDL